MMPLTAPTMSDRFPAPASPAITAAIPPTIAAMAAGREVMAGTRSTRKTRGTANSSGTSSGTVAPIRTPTIVLSCQELQSNSAAPR